MARRAAPSSTLMAAVRAYFGLGQEELAHYLGVSRGLVAHVETGRRQLSPAVYERLLPLALLVPDAPHPPVPDAELPATAPAPTPGPLDARRDYCAWKANQLRRELRAFTTRATHARHWQQALPVLLAALPSTDLVAGLPPATDPVAQQVWLQAWRTRQWLQSQPTGLSAADVAEWHLLRLRAEALETEAAALTALLPPAAGPGR
ncbi:MAG: helix-turn-helix transcriptional regulator [Hymenobacter sp.]|nr:helix-turn-helix transcriptional regulator [Hymenobacter sp.]